MICFLYFLLSSSFETSRWIFINPSQKNKNKKKQGSNLVTRIVEYSSNRHSVLSYYFGLYRQQDSLLVLTLWPWIKILMRGSMYNTAAYALNDLLSGFLWERQNSCSILEKCKWGSVWITDPVDNWGQTTPNIAYTHTPSTGVPAISMSWWSVSTSSSGSLLSISFKL